MLWLVLGRSRHQDALTKLEEHNRLGGNHKTAALAAAEEARLLRAKANEANAQLEPHAGCGSCRLHCNRQPHCADPARDHLQWVLLLPSGVLKHPGLE